MRSYDARLCRRRDCGEVRRTKRVVTPSVVRPHDLSSVFLYGLLELCLNLSDHSTLPPMYGNCTLVESVVYGDAGESCACKTALVRSLPPPQLQFSDISQIYIDSKSVGSRGIDI